MLLSSSKGLVYAGSMPGGPLGGGRGWKMGLKEDWYLYIIKASRYNVVFGEES